MNQLFQENRNAFLLLLVLFYVLLFAVYFFFYRPLSAELVQKEGQERILENDLAVLEAKLAAGADDEVDPVDELDKIRFEPQIPSQQKLDELILILNEIELVSGSSVSSISFAYSGSLPERVMTNGEEELESDTAEGGLVEKVQDELDERYDLEPEAGEQGESLRLIERPAGLEPITVSLSVQSPDYEHFQLFLEGIEKQERKMVVSSLNFTKPAEDELILSEDPDETISASVSLTTFYFKD